MLFAAAAVVQNQPMCCKVHSMARNAPRLGNGTHTQMAMGGWEGIQEEPFVFPCVCGTGTMWGHTPNMFLYLGSMCQAYLALGVFTVVPCKLLRGVVNPVLHQVNISFCLGCFQFLVSPNHS